MAEFIIRRTKVVRYVSDDGKVFSTEQECCEHEQKIKQEKENEKRLEVERRRKLNVINEKYNELQKLISEFEEEYEIKQRPHFAPVYELIDMLCL